MNRTLLIVLLIGALTFPAAFVPPPSVRAQLPDQVCSNVNNVSTVDLVITEYGPLYPDTTQNVRFTVRVTAAQTNPCILTNVYLVAYEGPEPNANSPRSQERTSFNAGEVKTMTITVPARSAGVHTHNIDALRATGTESAPATDPSVTGDNPKQKKFVTGHKPDLVVKRASATNGGKDPVRFVKGGAEVAKEDLETDYDPGAYSARVLVRNFGTTPVADPNTLPASTAYLVCTATNQALRADGGGVDNVPNDCPDGPTRGLDFDVSMNMTRGDRGAGGDELRLRAAAPAGVVLLHSSDDGLSGAEYCKPGKTLPAQAGLVVCELTVSLTNTIGFNMVRAGNWNVTVVADLDRDVPEVVGNRHSNIYQLNITKVKGANVRAESLSYRVWDPSGLRERPLCGSSSANPCSLGSDFIQVQGTFRNDGDIQAGLTEGGVARAKQSRPIQWKWEGDLVTLQPKGPSNPQGPDVYDGCTSADPNTWNNDGCKLAKGASAPTTGVLTTDVLSAAHEGLVTVRLVPDYEETQAQGWVVETDERDNVAEIKIFFLDTNPPVFRTVRIPPEFDVDTVTAAVQVREGRAFELQADIQEAGGVANVTGVLRDGNGTVVKTVYFRFKEETANADVDRWNATVRIAGFVGHLVLAINATDHAGLKAPVSEYQFQVREFPKTIVTSAAFVNRKSGAHNHPNNEAVWRGDATDRARNQVFVEATIAGTGYPASTADSQGRDTTADGKTMQIRFPNGTLFPKTGTIAVRTMGGCDVTAPGATVPQVLRGNECDNPALVGSAIERYTVFYVDSAECAYRNNTDTVNACQAYGAGHPQLDLTVAGNYTAVLNVTDINGRHATTEIPFKVTDRPYPPAGKPRFQRMESGTAVPSLPRLNQHDMAPATSQKITANVTDVLRVEDVYALARHIASAKEYRIPLLPQGTVDQRTRNGTYTTVLDVGIGKDLPRGGAYNVSIWAEDFAGYHARRNVGDLRVIDDKAPALTVLVDAEQEAGDRLQFVVTSVDETESQNATLRIQRPGTPLAAVDLAPWPARKALVHNQSTSISDIGTWSYEARAADFAGNEATVSGTVSVVENLPPRVRNWKPDVRSPDAADKNVYGPPLPEIEVEVVDTNTGVARDSVKMTVDGQTVTPRFEEKKEGERTVGFVLRHSMTTPLPDRKTVTVLVSAKDQTPGGGLEAKNVQHEFVVDAVRPTLTWKAEPSRVATDEVIVGKPSSITVTAADAASGPGVIKVEVTRLAGGRTEGAPVRFDYTKPFKLEDLTAVFKGRADYRIGIDVRDGVGNPADHVQAVLAYDDEPPFIAPLPPNAGQSREHVRASITDEGGVSAVFVQYWTSRTAPTDLAMEAQGDVWNATIPPFPKNTTVFFAIRATDIFGNTRTSPEDRFNASNVPPTVQITRPTPRQSVSGRTEVQWEARDVDFPTERLKITLLWARPGEPFKAVPGAQTLRNSGTYQLDTTLLPNGRVILRVLAGDDASFGEDQVEVSVENLGLIFVDAIVEPSKAKEGAEMLVSVKITQAVIEAHAIVMDAAGAVVANVSLRDDGQAPDSQAGDSLYAASFKAPGKGAYTVNLYALTTQGGALKTSAATFLVEDKGRSRFLPEFTALSAIVAVGVAAGLLGLRRRKA